MEPIRREAGKRMGLGDVTDKVIPRFALLAPPRTGAAVAARYFMPWDCHPAIAVTGSICIGSCLIAPNTVANDVAVRPRESPALVTIEHPSGSIDLLMDYQIRAGLFVLNSAGLLRTARKLMAGDLFVPSSIWDGGLGTQYDSKRLTVNYWHGPKPL